MRDALGHLRTIRLASPDGFEIAVDLARGDEGIVSGELSGEARSYAERLFDFPILDKLDEKAAIAAIVQPVRRRDVEYAPEAVERSLGWTEGYPFYIQQLGKHAWNLADSPPITRADVETAIPAAQQVLDRSIYEVRFQRATEAERRYMRAMADDGRGPYRTRVVAKRLAKPTSTLSPIRQRLIDKGLIYATVDYGFIDFTVPRFDEFVRRRMEL